MLIYLRALEGAVDLVEITGRLTLSEVIRVRTYLIRLVESGSGRMVIGFAQTSYVDSSGLAVFISVMKAMQKRGGRVALAGVPSELMDLIELSRLQSMFEIFESTEKAARVLATSQGVNERTTETGTRTLESQVWLSDSSISVPVRKRSARRYASPLLDKARAVAGRRAPTTSAAEQHALTDSGAFAAHDA
jgi:anti-sigma B factor antagonist